MILTAERPATNLYRVEVSGWDDNKAFFVENSELEWAEDPGKHVTISRGLSEGAVIFLRLLQPISNDRSHSVAYQAELVARNPEGQRQFRLRPALHAARLNCSNRAAKRSGKSVEMEQGSKMVVTARLLGSPKS
jgi:hypothetical protein